VFTAEGGTWLWCSTFTQRILKPAVNGNEDEPRNRPRTVAIRPGLTFHGLRHSHKTWLIADGAPEVEQRLLNNLQRRWRAARAEVKAHPRAPEPVARRLSDPVAA
jgi:integrase